MEIILFVWIWCVVMSALDKGNNWFEEVACSNTDFSSEFDVYIQSQENLHQNTLLKMQIQFN